MRSNMHDSLTLNKHLPIIGRNSRVPVQFQKNLFTNGLERRSNLFFASAPRMRAVIQRVLAASVQRAPSSTPPSPAVLTEPESLDPHFPTNSINEGLLVLLGIHRDDTDVDLEWMVKKLLNLQVFNDAQDARWKLAVRELNMEILCISQFTLYGNTAKGKKPDFHSSMAGPESQPMYERFLQRLGEEYDINRIQKGFFGERMLIDSRMDGPVTIILDSPVKKVGQGGQKYGRDGGPPEGPPHAADSD